MIRKLSIQFGLLAIALAGTSPASAQDLVRLPTTTETTDLQPTAVVAQYPLVADGFRTPTAVSIINGPPAVPAGPNGSTAANAAGVCKLQDLSDVWLLGYRGDRAGCHDCDCGSRGRYGDSVDRAVTAQINNGDAAQMILFHFHFASINGPTHRLSTYGVVRLAQFVGRLSTTNYPLVIEADDRLPEMDELRRQEVLSRLADLGVSIPENRVIIGRPRTRGLNGEDATILQELYGQNVRTRGVVPPISNGRNGSSVR